MEIWKDIVGFEGIYQVSNLGRVKSLGNDKNRKEKILKGSKDRVGYLFIRLNKEGKVKTFKVHRLVAQAFIPNTDNSLQVNHINEIKDDNRVENLEWCDCKYNINYGSRTEKTQKPILQFTKECEFIRKWKSGTQVEKEIGIKQNSISACLKGRCKTAAGYKWGYADDYEKIPFKVFDLEIYNKKIA